MKKEIKAVIFDLGGVVLSRGLWSFRAYLVEKYGVTDEQTRDVLIKKYYKSYFSGNMSEEEFWRGVLADLNIVTDWKELKAILLDYYVPNEGMYELITDLRNKGYKTYLLSDQTNDWWPLLNERHHISDYFDRTFISAEIGFHKPEKVFYEFVLKNINFLAEEILFIDDLQENLDPASKLGMNVILYSTTESLKKDLEDFGIYQRVD